VWAIGQSQLSTGAVTRVPKTKMFPLFNKIQAPAPPAYPRFCWNGTKRRQKHSFWVPDPPLFPRRGQSFPKHLWNVMDKRGIPSSRHE
jgi:hypothetical protein